MHARRPFFAMADIDENARRKAAGKKEIPRSPIAIEIVRRIDALFAIERSINGKSAEERLSTRHTLSRPLVDDLHAYMSAQLARLCAGPRPGQGDQLHSQALARLHPVPRRWACLPLEQCRRTRTARYCSWQKSWLFCGSDRGGHRAAAMYSLIVTAKMNGVDPQAWPTDLLSRIATHPAHRLDELLPWNWKARAPFIPAQAA